MEALEDSSCPSLSDSFSLYERYVRSFDVVDNLRGEKSFQEIVDDGSNRVSNEGNLLLNIRNGDDVMTSVESNKHLFGSLDVQSANTTTLCKPCSPYNLVETSLQSSTTTDSIQTEKYDPIEIPLTSEDSKSEHSLCPKPVIITSSAIMENSNNAVDSGPLFCSKSPESVFKLPIKELTFNGSLKHVKSLKPIVDPSAALNSAVHIEEPYKVYTDAKTIREAAMQQNNEIATQDIHSNTNSSSSGNKTVHSTQSVDTANNSTGDSLYQDFYSQKQRQHYSNQEKILESSYSSLEGSFDSGVRSPDMFSEDEDTPIEHINFWDFLNEYEAKDKIKMKKLEEILQGVLPPPSVTNLRTNVTEMLKKYYSFLPAFSEDANITPPSDNSVTPTKRTSFVKIPLDTQSPELLQEITETNRPEPSKEIQYENLKSLEGINSNKIDSIASNAIENPSQNNCNKIIHIIEHKDINGHNDIIGHNDINGDNDINNDNDIVNKPDSLVDMTNNFDISNNVNLEMCNSAVKVANLNEIPNPADNNLNKINDKTDPIDTMTKELEAQNTQWPDILKCRYHDVYYNMTKYSERMELLALRCGERFIGTETNSSVTVYSGDLQSPNSACKRKALRLKMAQAKSPGRRLSHLARRRQAFCSAATFGERPTSTAKMVLIDKKKLINTGRSPRLRRTPGKRTPGRKTPAKKTPAKTPKTRSGGTNKKKIVRRLIAEGTRTLPTRETSKRALFISPENRKSIPQVASTSVPVHAMKSKRALFPSPDRLAETKSADGSLSDQFMKRKREFDSDDVESRSKMAKSLSFGGDSISQGHSSSMFARRASEMFSSKNSMANLDENQRKKLLWAVSEALRIHGWRMQSPGFREKAGALARLTRRLLTLPYHNARMNAPKLSTSETFLKIARQYVFAIIKGKSIEDCFQEEQERLANESTQKVTGYISASTYQQIRVRQTNTLVSSRIKENSCDGVKQEQQRSGSKNVLQDKLLNVDNNSNSNSSLGVSLLNKTGIYKSNSMPSFEDAAKMRARRQISFDSVDFPKR